MTTATFRSEKGHFPTFYRALRRKFFLGTSPQTPIFQQAAYITYSLFIATRREYFGMNLFSFATDMQNANAFRQYPPNNRIKLLLSVLLSDLKNQ